jgi:hypothetical protein
MSNFFSSIFTKLKDVVKGDDSSILKDERVIKLFSACLDLIKNQIELSIKYSKEFLTKTYHLWDSVLCIQDLIG